MCIRDSIYYEVYSLPRAEEVPEGYKELSFVCLRPDGAFEAPSTVGIMCRTARTKLEGLAAVSYTHLDVYKRPMHCNELTIIVKRKPIAIA